MEQFFTRFASKAASLLGDPKAFIWSTVLIVIWAISGPFLHYSDTWQLIVNTATTVLTFLAVFLIQNSQNRDGAATQASSTRYSAPWKVPDHSSSASST